MHLGKFICQCLTSNSNYARRISLAIKNIVIKYDNQILFIKALIINPRTTGAALPSSKRLAEAMAAHVSLAEAGLIVELGAGTGVVTDALLQRGVHPSRIVAVELSAELAEKSRNKFPSVEIITGDASHLQQLLGNRINVSTIISSLPLRSLPKPTTIKILEEIVKVLPENGKYIQFTYSYRKNIIRRLIITRRLVQKESGAISRLRE